MIKKLLTTFVFCFGTFFGFCQEFDYEFIGTILTGSKEIMYYKVSFSETELGMLEGESVTDLYGANSTVSKIIGEINWETNHFSFEEIQNVSTNSSADAASFCYIHASNLFIKSKDDKAVIKGRFNGYYTDGTDCANGEIYMVSKDFFKSTKLKPFNIDSIASILLNQKDAIKIQNATKQVKELNSSEVLNIGWKSKKVVLKLWDNFQEDEDMVNVFINGKLMYKDFEIKKKAQEIVLDFNENEKIFNIRIEAVNVGLTPPNTAHVILEDNTESHPLVTILNKGQFVNINLTR